MGHRMWSSVPEASRRRACGVLLSLVLPFLLPLPLSWAMDHGWMRAGQSIADGLPCVEAGLDPVASIRS